MGVRINIHSDRFTVKGDAKYLALALFRVSKINKRLAEAIKITNEWLSSYQQQLEQESSMEEKQKNS